MIDSEIALRCFNKPKSTKDKYSGYNLDYDIPDRVLVFDTETTIDEYQNLLFGYFEVYNRSELEYKGLFYNSILTKKQLDTLKQYSDKNNIRLFDVRLFVDRIFFPEVYINKTQCIGFNLPFDLSRIAISSNTSKSRYFHNAYSFKLSNNPENPRLIIKHKDRNSSFIQFTKSYTGKRSYIRKKRKTNNYPGNFIDLKTFTFALTNKSMSLQNACSTFDTDVKKSIADSHGKITEKYIDYCINDVKATYSLYQALKKEYKGYDLDIPLNKIFSPASIGKQYIQAMNIKPFMEKNPDFPDEILGYMMTTYYGGRSEVRIRHEPTEISLIDFLSMYPSVNVLQDLWQFVICDHVDHFDDTETVKDFVEGINLNDLQNPDIWKQLHCIVQILPDNDILPIRSKYDSKNTYNIGINHLRIHKPLWYSLSDVIASKLFTGRSPQILKAYRFKPIGIQKGLEEIKIIGNKKFNPNTDDLFKTLIEYRVKIKAKRDSFDKDSEEYKHYDNLQNNIKIIANSTSYGIYVEINTKHLRSKTDIDVYGLEHFESIEKNRIETFGIAFNPIMAICITSASRLVLAINERILMNNDSKYAFCDTDSMAVNPDMVKPIQEFFQPLNPYSFDKNLFELEHDRIMFYGISAKRYVLFKLINNKPEIIKYSYHGLGHLFNPFQVDIRDWYKELWQDILNELYGISDSSEIDQKYQDKYCISRITISSPEIMKRFRTLNKNKPYSKQIKPFNFILVGTSNQSNPETNKPVKPVIPFTKDYRSAPFQEFIDYNSGNQLIGIEYWKSFDYVFWEYKNHPESKFNGNSGFLIRKKIIIKNIIYIGKESNKLEYSQIFGINNKTIKKYIPNQFKSNSNPFINNQKYGKLIFKLTKSKTIQYGISKLQLIRMRNKLKLNKSLKLNQKTIKQLDFLMIKYRELID